MRALELKVPPIVVVAVFAVAMWGVSAIWPVAVVDFPGRVVLAGLPAGVGVALVLICGRAFMKAKTTFMPHAPDKSSALVVSGLYRYSRNPMYLGMLLALIGWAVFWAHPAAFPLLPAFVLYMNRFQIMPEERALAANFGAEFDDYRRRTRRWL